MKNESEKRPGWSGRGGKFPEAQPGLRYLCAVNFLFLKIFYIVKKSKLFKLFTGNCYE